VTKRLFKLSSNLSPVEKLITHLQATRWEDDSVITDTEHYEDLNKLLRSVKKRRTPNESGVRPAPIVVHCSAGIGRTGTMLAIYSIMEAVEWLQKQSQLSD
jgi:protein tyrosine phosphatase